MKTILVPTDFSKNANHALKYAIELAKKENAKILLLHAYQTTYVAPDVPYQYAAAIFGVAQELAEKKLKSQLLKTKAQGVQCESLNIEGSIVHTITEVAEKKKPYLIVMGTKGASGFAEVIIGSNTAQVIEKAKCPVIAVPEKTKLSTIENISYATDYHKSDIDALKRLVEIAKWFDASITILHVADQSLGYDDDEDFMIKFKKKVSSKIKYPKIHYKLIYGRNVVKDLEAYIKTGKPDLFAMSMHHRNLYEKLFGTSTTKKLAYHTKVPLLAFHYKQDSVFFI
ncbi:MAG: universal stress protein [Bacteroidia bacterium]